MRVTTRSRRRGRAPADGGVVDARTSSASRSSRAPTARSRSRPTACSAPIARGRRAARGPGRSRAARRRRRASDDPRQRYTHLELGPYTRLARRCGPGSRAAPADAAVPVPTFADGLAEMRVLDAIRASAARRRRARRGRTRRDRVERGPCTFSSQPTVRRARSPRPARRAQLLRAGRSRHAGERAHRSSRRRRRRHRGLRVLGRRAGRSCGSRRWPRPARRSSAPRPRSPTHAGSTSASRSVTSAGRCAGSPPNSNVDVIVVGSHGRGAIVTDPARLGQRAGRAPRAVPGARRAPGARDAR